MIITKADLIEYLKADFGVQEMKYPLLSRLTLGENYAMFSYIKICDTLSITSIKNRNFGIKFFIIII